MHRDDKSLFLLYIEPKKEERSEFPVVDMLTVGMEIALNESISGSANYSKTDQEPRFQHGNGWRGWHSTDCGETSDNHDYLLRSGNITNKLATFYLKWYRNSIPKNDMIKMADVLSSHYFEMPYERNEILEKIKELRELEK
jgi:hypothetical protein